MFGRVLVIENTVSFAEAACSELKSRGIDAMSVPVPPHAGLTAKQHEDLVVQAVKEKLEDERLKPFDLLITNLNLQNESETPRRPIGYGENIMEDARDSHGLGVVSYMADEHPGIYCIVFTGDPPIKIKNFIDTYNIAGWTGKDNREQNIVNLCDEVMRVLREGHRVRRIMPKTGRVYEIQGVEAMIYRFLRNRGILQRVFGGVPDYDNRLFLVLGGHSAKEAVDLMSDLWHAETSLFRYPLADRLGEMESGATYWKGHREHLVHQLRVYLFGLYLYYGCSKLRAMLDGLSEDMFLSAWKMMALFHDIGYVFEVEFAQQSSERYQLAFDELNDLTTYGLYHYFGSRVSGPRLTRAQDERIRENQRAYPYTLVAGNAGNVLGLANLGVRDLFHDLNEEGQRAGLSNRRTCTRDYWDYARTKWTRSRSREPFVDHGITSALILLRLSYTLEEYARKALREVQKKKQDIVDQQLVKAISELNFAIAERRQAVEIAARAIALHNVRVKEWDENDAFREKHLTLESYSLSQQRTPLSFFLALVDELQSWDRPFFAYQAEKVSETLAQDVHIEFDLAGKIVITFRTDDKKGRHDSRFKVALEEMAKYMNRNDLDDLLQEGPAVLPMPADKQMPFAQPAQPVHAVLSGPEWQRSINQITVILANLSSFVDGEARDRRLLCRQAGVVEVLDQQIWSNDSRIVAGHIVNALADYGVLPHRREYHALGGLIDYLLTLEEIPLADRQFMAQIVMRFNLVTESGYLDRLRDRWQLPQADGTVVLPTSE